MTVLFNQSPCIPDKRRTLWATCWICSQFIQFKISGFLKLPPCAVTFVRNISLSTWKSSMKKSLCCLFLQFVTQELSCRLVASPAISSLRTSLKTGSGFWSRLRKWIQLSSPVRWQRQAWLRDRNLQNPDKRFSVLASLKKTEDRKIK